MDHLKADLDNYMSQYPKVKIVRAPERVGLIWARLLGASKAFAQFKNTYARSKNKIAQSFDEFLKNGSG